MVHSKQISSIRNRTSLGSLLFLVGFSLTINAWAQIQDIPIGKEVTMDRLYAGLLANTPFLERNEAYRHASSLQMGARIHFWLIPKKLRIRSFGVVKLVQEQPSKFFRSYEAIFTPHENLAVHMGSMATPTTELRPNPTTWQSQVETNAERTILGGRPGIKVQYRFVNNLRISYGLHNHNGLAAQHLKISYKNLSVSNYLEGNTQFFAVGWHFKNGRLIATAFKKLTAVALVLPIVPSYRIYMDMAHDHDKGNLSFGEWGVRKQFPHHRIVKGFISLSYNHTLRNFQGGLFLHI